MHVFVISIFRIGLLCSKESAKERMVMGDVIKELHLVKKMLDRIQHVEPAHSNGDQNH